jgi:putative hemolysin
MQPRRNLGTDAPVASSRLTVHVARDSAEVAEAQRLRYEVFVEEMGARLTATDGREHDEFDPWCDHLIVREADTLRVVGTYRMLPPQRARELGRLYSETEFDLSRFASLRPALIEVGRSCVHRDYRSGSTILLLWAGLARYMKQGGYRHLIGCASVPRADGGAQAARIRDELQRSLTPVEYRVFPRLPFPHEKIERAAQFELPPLLKGYLRLGGQICGEPAWDPDFNSADFLVWVALDSLNARYARHFDLLARTAEQAEA